MTMMIPTNPYFALFPICFAISALLALTHTASLTRPTSFSLQSPNNTLGYTRVVVPGTSTVLLFDPVDLPLDSGAVTTFVISSLHFILEQIHAHGTTSLIADSGVCPEGTFTRTRDDGYWVAVIPLAGFELTWGELEDVVEGIRIWEIDRNKYGVAHFQYMEGRTVEGYGYLVSDADAAS